MLAALILAASFGSTTASAHLRIAGNIEASLARILPDEASALGAQVARLLRWRGDFVRNVHPKDELHLVYEEGPTPELVAMKYAGAEITLAAYRYTAGDGVPRFYGESGRLIEPVIQNAPLASYTQITETVQSGRGKRRHAGVDFKAPEGTPVRLPFAAQVARVNWSRRVNGNCIEVRLGGGKLMRFLHLSRVEATVLRGATLSAGAIVGAVGNTGHSSAAHLHYEIRDAAGRPVDPLKLHGTTTAQLSSEELADFIDLRGRLDAQLARPSASLAGPRSHERSAPAACRGKAPVRLASSAMNL